MINKEKIYRGMVHDYIDFDKGAHNHDNYCCVYARMTCDHVDFKTYKT